MKYLLFGGSIIVLVGLTAWGLAYLDMYTHLSRPDAKKWP